MAFVVVLVVAVASGGALRAHATTGWQANALGLDAAWEVTRGSPSTVVAVVDSGVQADHPALAERVLPGYDFVNNDDDASDDNGHGTALAGIVASTCPGCRILPVKVLDGRATGDLGTIAAGVTWAVAHGARVINLSAGASRAPDSLGDAVAGALAKGVIVVAAAGNDGRNEQFLPARYPGVVSVGGIDENRARYGWSNFGDWVTVAAPGCTASAWLGGSYTASFCGTSTAAPFVAGVAGLAKSFRASLTPADFAAAIGASATPVADAEAFAHGSVDANGLLVALGAPTAAPGVSVAPSVVGVPRVGHRLVARPGRWSQEPTTAVQWQRLDGGSWRPLARGTGYTPSRFDVRYRLRVLVTATNGRGAASAASAVTARVARRTGV